MKLKKIISLTLVFAMMLTMFAALTVSAEGTATLNYVAYDSNGKAVTGNLEAGKIYEIAIEYSNVDTELYSSEVKTTYNPEVLQLVNSNGGEIEYLTDAVTTKLDASKFEPGPEVIEENAFTYSYNVKLNLTKIDSVDLGDKFELFRFRVKALKNGKAGISTSAQDAFFYNNRSMTTATVTIVPNSIRVGEVAYVSATPDAGFVAEEEYVLGKTTLEDVVADLDEKYPTVKVTFTDEEDGVSDSVDCEITWAANGTFGANKADTYKFVGTVAVPENINYTGEAITVEATVTVQPLTVVGFSPIDDLTIRQNVDSVTLPETVLVEVTGGEYKEMAATWSPAAVDNTAVGTATYTATIESTADITVPADKSTVSFDVTVVGQSATTAPEASAIEAVVVNSNIDGDIELPKFVTLADGYITVESWEIKTVNGETPADGYVPAIGDVITYAPKFAEGFTAPADFVATVTVVVPEGKKEVNFSITLKTEAKAKNDANYTIADAQKEVGFEGKIGEYKDGTAVDASEIVWDKDTTPAYNNAEPGEYTLNGVWNDVYGNGPINFEIKITIEQAGATDFYFTLNKNTKKEIKSRVYMTAGTFDDVYVIFKPEDADDEIVEWKSSNTSRATVEKRDATSARVKARQSVGLVKISAKTKSGIEKSFDVVVEAATVPGSSYVTGGNNGNFSILAQAVEEAEGINAAQNSVFGDLAGYEWAATQIDTLRLLGIVSGKSATAYAPADSVTRAEYLAMLVRLLNLKANGEAKVFTDVNAGDWFYDTVNVASSLGIAYGYENGAFDPNAVIKRQDMAVFAKRAIEVAGLTPAVGVTSTFEDQADIAPYALDSVLYMTSVGAINGMGNGTFKPLETANRAQAAVVIYNIYAIKSK